MWRLFRQWRYVRWVYKELLGHEEAQDMSGFGQAMLLSPQAAIDEYKKRRFVFASKVRVRRVLEQCLVDGYLVQQDNEGPSIRVTPSKGENFKPIISGLLFGEVALLTPVQQVLGTGLVTSLVWVVLSFSHIVKW
jgi:hypothetical protein